MSRRSTSRTASTLSGRLELNALIAAAIGALFSSVLPNLTKLLPSWWGIYGWFFGVAIGGGTYGHAGDADAAVDRAAGDVVRGYRARGPPWRLADRTGACGFARIP